MESWVLSNVDTTIQRNERYGDAFVLSLTIRRIKTTPAHLSDNASRASLCENTTPSITRVYPISSHTSRTRQRESLTYTSNPCMTYGLPDPPMYLSSVLQPQHRVYADPFLTSPVAAMPRKKFKTSSRALDGKRWVSNRGMDWEKYNTG